MTIQNGNATQFKAEAFDGLMSKADEKPGRTVTFGYASRGEYREYEICLKHIDWDRFDLSSEDMP